MFPTMWRVSYNMKNRPLKRLRIVYGEYNDLLEYE